MTWNNNIPLATNQISADLADMNENYKVLGSYNTIWIGAGSMTPLSTNGAEAGVHEFATNDIMMPYLAFDDGTEEYAAFSLVMPENWSLGTIKFKAYWLGASGCSADDTVEWELAAYAFSNDDAIDHALGSAQVISDAITADGDVQITGASPAITIGGTPAAEDLIHFKLSRNVGGTDDMEEDAWLFGIVIEYQANVDISSAWS